MNAIIPLLICLLLTWGLARRKNVYGCFVEGATRAFPLALSIFPYLAATFIMVNAMEKSGLDVYVVEVLWQPFRLLGVPKEVVRLLFLRPFSGSGSIAMLQDLLARYGADSYVGRCASVIAGSGETVFYVAGVYFSQVKGVRTGMAVPIALFCNFLGGVLGCLLCRVM